MHKSKKIKLQLISDVHTEFHGTDQGRKILNRLINKTADEVDAILIPGDLSTTKGLRYAFSILCDSYKNVIFTQGNHEYYSSSKGETEDLLQECADKHSNLHWLDRGTVEIDGQRFVGTTLWFPPTGPALSMRNQFNDFRVIESGRDKFSRFPHWILEEFSKNKVFLEDNVQEGDVVLTHHIPCKDGIHPNWVGDPGNCFFMGDVSDVIDKVKAKAWVFGHTHNAMSFSIGKTDFHCNPCAYPNEPEYKNFNDSLVFEV